MKSKSFSILFLLALPAFAQDDPDLQRVLAFQDRLRNVVDRVKPAFVFCGGGSAVCISKDGWILTNHHVAGPSGRQWKVFFSGGKGYNAKVVGHDPNGDLSLLKVDADHDLPFAELGDSDALQMGQHVFAVGNPFLLGNGKGAPPMPGAGKMARADGNWEPTVTLGVVSALHRFQDWYMDAIHTDCQINPGNSGGPLFTLEGKVVGINGRIAMRFMNRVNTGVGYAIPSNQIKRYMEHFKKGGRVWHGFIQGLVIAEAGTPGYENAGEYGDGVLVLGVEQDTPASRGGFQSGDMITEIAGYRIFNTNRMHGVLGTFPQTETVSVKVKRGTETKELKVWIGDWNKFGPKDEKKESEKKDD